jgi:transcriptional regulator with PAS, ATPase and Fis domain
MPSRRPPAPSTTVKSTGTDAAPRVAQLVLIVGPDVLITRTFDRPLVLGRDADCDIAIDSPKVSRRHARIAPGPPATVQDLGSTNGVKVRGKKHVGGGPVALDIGDGFQVGPFSVLVLPGGDGRASGEPRARLVVDDPTPGGVHPTVARIAASPINLLLHGETGAGKEVLARTVHALSKRAGPFLALNCAAVHTGLLESELFGHERGAFTGAVQARPGLLESAAGGTVFLDEIGDLPLEVQAKLLRVIEAREVFRLGSAKPVALDVRFVAATHRDLRDDVARGAFREDLYYRLDGVTLAIPPLRERRGAILPLAERLLAEAAKRLGEPRTPTLGPDAAAVLHGHAWPGNVRELRAVLERAVLLAEDGEIRPEHLVLEPPRPGLRRDDGDDAAAAGARDGLSPDEAAERDRIVRALDDCAGNQTRAAKMLGISRATLVTRLKLYRIPRPRR